MTITLNTKNEQLFDKVLWLLNHFKKDGLEIISHNSTLEKVKEPINKGIDFSLFKVDSFKELESK